MIADDAYDLMVALRGLVLTFFAALGVGGAALIAASCTSFGEVDAPGSDEASTPAEAGSEGTADSGGDSSIVGVGPDGCFVLSPNAGFVSMMSGGGMATSTPAGGLGISYTAQTGESSVEWLRQVSIPVGRNAATLTVEAKVHFPNALPNDRFAYADLAGIVNGPISQLTTGSAVLAVFAFADTGSASIDVDTFPKGTDNSNTMSADGFGDVSVGDQSIKVVMDVIWSTDANMENARATLGEGATTIVSKATLSGDVQSAWTVILGGYIGKNPAFNIEYTRVCLAARTEKP